MLSESRAVISAISPADLPVRDPAAGPEIGNPWIKRGVPGCEAVPNGENFQLGKSDGTAKTIHCHFHHCP